MAIYDGEFELAEPAPGLGKVIRYQHVTSSPEGFECEVYHLQGRWVPFTVRADDVAAHGRALHAHFTELEGAAE